MQCSRCHTDNRAGRKFCAACGQALALPCPQCAFVNDADDRFCGGCGQALTAAPAASPAVPSPQSYTPTHLAEKILASRTTLEGERKQVTVLFADLVKGLAEPIEVYELVGASALGRRLQAAVARGLTQFVGRQPELDALYRALEQTMATARIVHQALCHLSLGETQVLADSQEGGARPCRTHTGARPSAPETRSPGVCPAPPRRHCGAA